MAEIGWNACPRCKLQNMAAHDFAHPVLQSKRPRRAMKPEIIYPLFSGDREQGDLRGQRGRKRLPTYVKVSRWR